jgi:phosphate transport system substrate-binding protein
MTTLSSMLKGSMLKGALALAIVASTTVTTFADTKVTVDPKLPTYKPVDGVSGSIKSIGSDTLNNLMTFWGEGFKKIYPNVTIEIEGKGSTTAPPALIEGTAAFGPMSRTMKNEEVDKFVAKYGYKPTAIPTSLDMLAVYVNKDNPVKGLSLQEVDAIFSKTRKGGSKDDITTWGQVKLEGDWSKLPISLYGRNSASGTYGYFKEHALFKGDFKDTVKEQAGSSSVVQSVATDKGGIGYSGIGYKTADVRAVPLSAKPDGKYVEASVEHAYDGTYPMARFLYIYVNAKPNEQLDPLRKEFIKYILSKQGQEEVVKDGYYPVPAAIAEKALKGLGIDK